VTLLQHFWSYLEGNEKPKTLMAQNAASNEKQVRKVKDVVYVKKWMRTRHAIMFRLSNKVVQVNFQDHTEIMLSSETKVVTYVNKKGERCTYPLNSAMESSNLEMVKRLKYTKDILTHMLNANAAQVKIKEDANPIGDDTAKGASQTNRPATTAGVQGSSNPRGQVSERINSRPYSSQMNSKSGPDGGANF
jgi:hypothetical protein